MNQSAPAQSVSVAEKDLVSAVPVLNSKALFGPHRRILIQHSGSHYQLQITRLGKLILTR